MKKSVFLLLNLLFTTFLSQKLNAEKINFPLHGSQVQIDWDEKCFGEKSSFEYSHKLARIACYFSDAAYSDVAETKNANDLFNAYKKIGVKESEIEAHYDINYTDAMWGNDQCAFSIASKKIKSSKGEQTLVFVIMRGTPLNANEWLSNLNINDANKMQESIHKGFARAANIIHTALISYMLRHKIDPTDSFLFMTGHSRGAAVANMLSVIILSDDFFKPENIYTYTFASPNVTTLSVSETEKYGFIWNIVNAEDIVPTVPMNIDENWKFRKFGKTLAFSNQTNTDKNLYTGDFVPRINTFYEKFSGRPYKPFTTGPFVPIVVTKLISYLTGDVEKYYSGAMELHRRAAGLMNKIFPEKNDGSETSSDTESEQRKGGIGSWMISYLNRRTNGLVDYVVLALSDMHSNDVYLSYMLALDENEAFSQLGYSLVVVKGYEEFAVFDTQGNMLARVLDGKIIYENMKFPMILCPALGKNVIVGYPSNQDFTIAITDEALFPTPATFTVEYYDAAGVYKESKSKKLFPRRGFVYEAEIGNKILENPEISPKRAPFLDGIATIKKASLRPQRIVHLNIEANMNQNKDFSLGAHFGNQLIFASLMTRPCDIKFNRHGEIDFGLGNQQTLYGQIKIENEAFGKFIWLDSDEEKFNFVPEWRTSLSLKVLGRMRLFAAGTLDFKIKDFNEAAFESDWISPITSFSWGNSVKACPSIQLGVRF